MAPTVPIEYIGQWESKACLQRNHSVMMGKTRKFPKGNSTGFVPDNRHLIETVAESEGFGSSGRVDTEMTVSEDSYAPKRKCINLNVDNYDQFGVPLQVLSLSKMSQSERKGLEMRLKSELEQVRFLQKKIGSVNPSAVVLSPSSDIRSCSEGQKRASVEILQRSVDVPTSKGKKWAPPGRNGSLTKQAAGGRVKSVKQAVPSSNSNATWKKQCESLLNKTMSQGHAWVFNSPVDVVKLKIPDYFNVIKHPMDLGTVKNKLLESKYPSPLGFAADVRLTFDNAQTYNPPGNDVHVMAVELSKYFERRWKLIEKKFPVSIDAPVHLTSSGHIETEIPNLMPPSPSKKRKITPIDNKVKQEPVKRVMTAEEKIKLSTELESLVELPESIIDFLKKQSYDASQIEDDEIEIDLDALTDDTLFTLRKLLDDFLLDQQKKQGGAEPRDMLPHDSGFSNVAAEQCKGNDPVDEDVDIGGNDPPILSYPPVEIEKDTAIRTSQCSSSSGSSSSSASSSSDSDSGSSGSESDGGPRAPVLAVGTKEDIDSGANIDQKKNDQDLLNGLSKVEQNSQPNALTVDVKGLEGESAPSGRQVSPEKLYRAALLRSRFADTILKAQEKTLEKGEKQDSEKLRLEREELERRRREEKARLQAEAKAAEEARRKAEADAAAEAKRKRELERAAARQALQKMEKTVDINEGCQFMEDLEMLRTSAADEMARFVDDASPEHSQNALGSFKFQGSSNPLEQLGLYMKVDDEEEDEGESHPLPDAGNDTEEGEID
ncbi:transcription factor GTE10-like [Diospyros lotus]|uniref:transcription factor GTE10-like n=1 Tax=Diospyros lotus TaxID=55363 RepID=UPI00225C0467|nr:transcription factor GTE10-like [Diospyros lotus]XP_052175007.1 transcription factor GTE10-like [Diospyros lotus]